MAYLSVSDVADFLGVSERRVRFLLSEGRIQGFRDEAGIWRIGHPLDITPGHRSPDLKNYSSRKLISRQLKFLKK